MDFDTKLTSFYVIKTFSRANVHKSIKYGVWCSTASVNSTLNLAFQAGHRVILLFSIAGSKEFCGIAEMTSSVLFDVRFMLWEKLKYDGLFQVKWHSIRNVANFKLKHVIYDGRPIVNSRDGVFIDMQQGKLFVECFQEVESLNSMMEVMHQYDQEQIVLEQTRKIGQSCHEKIPFVMKI